jgi:undecaprenyl-diphosphatase
LFIAFNLIVFGILLWYVDKKSKNDLAPQKLTYKTSFLIGLSQAIALIPGVSRSGITLTAARWMGVKREEAARFSFLLATPTIVGAFLIKLPELERDGIGATFWLGILASTIFGMLAIKFFLNYLKKSDLAIFMWYRIAIGLLVVGVYLIR